MISFESGALGFPQINPDLVGIALGFQHQTAGY